MRSNADVLTMPSFMTRKHSKASDKQRHDTNFEDKVRTSSLYRAVQGHDTNFEDKVRTSSLYVQFHHLGSSMVIGESPLVICTNMTHRTITLASKGIVCKYIVFCDTFFVF